MKEEEEIKKHIRYLTRATDRTDPKQMRELNVRVSELIWVLDKKHKC